MSFEQRVGNGWRCDGCGKIAPWGKGWRSFGTIAEQDDGLLRWVSCSKACADAIPPDLRDLEIPKTQGGIWGETMDMVAGMRAKGGWRAARGTPGEKEGT